MINAMSTADLEAFRALCEQGESAVELFTIWTGKKATRIYADLVEIEFPASRYCNSLRVKATYLIENMNAFACGRYP